MLMFQGFFLALVSWQQAAGERVGKGHHHLHSTATLFWAGEEEVGLIPVSEEAEDVPGAAGVTSRSFFFNRFLLLSMDATSDFKDV